MHLLILTQMEEKIIWPGVHQSQGPRWQHLDKGLQNDIGRDTEHKAKEESWLAVTSRSVLSTFSFSKMRPFPSSEENT